MSEYLIDRYRVGHYAFAVNSASVPDAVILCYASGFTEPVAELCFYKLNDDRRTTPLGGPRVQNERIKMDFRLDRYEQILDMLRHESPILIWADDGLGLIHTPAKEPIGEGDVDPLRSLRFLSDDALVR